MEHNVLEQMGFIIGDWIPKEASIAIAVDGCYIYCKEGIQRLPIVEGQPVLAGSIADHVGKEGKRIEKGVDAAVAGWPYYGIGYPVQIGGMSGVLVVILPADYPLRQKGPLKFLTGKMEEAWRPVPVERISHIESSQKKTWFYAEEETYCSIHTLKNLRSQLPDYFLPVHRAYIVNIHYIEEISRDLASNLGLTLKDGSVLPISQNFAAEVRERLGF
ncbi:LytR/AlgR family response regulator transcription factor [Planococcus sp. FY231025]|uniref:LytR/AlgR family response regulator transcription factor n=1 Tax=Planococcus sp. FY231025 TaxID=3455699 RepID=UPI003F9151B1